MITQIFFLICSEELFDFSTGQLTQAKSKHLKDTMCQQFREVFTLCQHVFEQSRNEKLILCTLETMLRFINWIPLGYIFETGLFNPLIYKVCYHFSIFILTFLISNLLFFFSSFFLILCFVMQL